MVKKIPLTKMNANEFGKVVEIRKKELIRKLENMGIRIGTEIRKISQQPIKGPVIISHKNTQVAMGYGIARQIIVEMKKQ